MSGEQKTAAANLWRRLGPNTFGLGFVSLLNDVSSEIIYPLLPLFLTNTLGVGPIFLGAIEGAAESVASLLKVGSGWFSDRLRRRKWLVVAGYSLAAGMRPAIAVASAGWHVLVARLVDRAGKGIRSAPRDALLAASAEPGLRGSAFGFQRAMDHLGAVLGPLGATLALPLVGGDYRRLFWLAAVPGAAAVVLVITAVADVAAPSAVSAAVQRPEPAKHLGSRTWIFLGIVAVFTLGNSSDAFLLWRANQLGVPPAEVPALWIVLHLVKSATSWPAGAVSDRLGRRTLIIAGWAIYAGVYFGFAMATTSMQIWILFAVYGLFYGLTEGAERALISDLAPEERRGAAFGLYHGAIGIAAFPASLIAGIVWQHYGPARAFELGAGLAAVAAIALSVAMKPARP